MNSTLPQRILKILSNIKVSFGFRFQRKKVICLYRDFSDGNVIIAIKDVQILSECGYYY